jgi:hypothetical protein
MRSSSILGLLVVTSVFAGACASDDAPPTEDNVSNGLTSRFADLKKIRVDELSRVAAGFATDKLNDSLSAGPLSTKFAGTQVFGAAAEQNSVLPANAKVKSLAELKQGLASEFGDADFSTRLTASRLKYLQDTADTYYVESSVDLGAGVDHGWTHSAAGFSAGAASLSVGFEAGVSLKSRVVLAAPKAGLRQMYDAPASAVKGLRGFVFPRSLDEVKAMKTGEMLSLSGTGKIGGHFGVGVPVLAAAGAGITYNVVLSAGASGVLSGELDVNLVRLEGDEVAVEVGVTKGSLSNFGIALTGGFGVNNVCGAESCLRPLKIAGAEVNLQKLAESALQKQLNTLLQTRVAASQANESSRVTVSRVRFHLDRGADVGVALEQALKADLRMAQGMAARDLGEVEPGVEVDFDLVRSAATTTRDFGATVFGLDIYHRKVVEKEGGFAIQTPSGTQSVLFETLEKRSGWFQMDHGFKRTSIAASTVDVKDPTASRNEANLFLQAVVGDSHMDDDILIDSADATFTAAPWNARFGKTVRFKKVQKDRGARLTKSVTSSYSVAAPRWSK